MKPSRKLVSSVAVVASLVAFWVPAPAPARATPFRMHIELPPGEHDGALVWGVVHNGLEVCRGLQGLDPIPNRIEWLTLPSKTTNDLVETESPYTLRLCINYTPPHGYFPSVGDLYQSVPLKFYQEKKRWIAVAQADSWKKREILPPENLLTVHYHRNDGEYTNVTVWTWDEHLKRAPKENEVFPVGHDKFGLVFEIDTSKYGQPGDSIGLVPRRNQDWQHKEGSDRIWKPASGMNVYMVQDENELYREEPDVSPKVRRVALDADHNLTIRFSHRLPVADWTPEKFTLKTSTGERVPIKAVYPFKHRGDECALYSLETEERIEYPQKSYALTVEGFGTYDVTVGYIVKDPERFFDADAKMGATYTSQATTFRVFAPGALAVEVVVADALAGNEGVVRHEMSNNGKGIWSAAVEGDLAGKYYAYTLRGIGFDPDEEITDIYATCTQGRHARSLIVDLDKTDPPGFDDYVYRGSPSLVDAIIYEMHVRDLTQAANSGVTRKGKYLGLTESGTSLPSDPTVKTGLDHLVEMGVTHVQIMPVQDFDNAEDGNDSYNWGYMPVHFNSPEGWYATDASGAGRIRELKLAIDALHQRGIGVIMDVVYNHTASWAPFEKLVPGYYYRLTDSGNFSDGSGCGNEFASENPMARKFIRDSLKYWVQEYKIDGFRFDLMGLIDLETLKLAKADLEAIHPGILLYGEPWTAAPTPLKPITDKQHAAGSGVGAFNDGFRDAIKGGRDGGMPGFIQTGDNVDGVVKGLMGGIHDWSKDPTDSVGYFEAHDNLTTWDKLLQSVPDGDNALRKRMLRFGALTLFTAQGAVFMHSGQEMCRTKKGSYNSYNLSDEYNEIDWELKKQNADVVEYHKGLIALRKSHPAFRLRTRAEVEKRVSFATPPDPRAIEYHIDAEGVPGESAKKILVLLNGASHAVSFKLAGELAGGEENREWQLHADAERANTKPLRQVNGEIEVGPHSGVLLIQ